MFHVIQVVQVAYSALIKNFERKKKKIFSRIWVRGDCEDSV